MASQGDMRDGQTNQLTLKLGIATALSIDMARKSAGVGKQAQARPYQYSNCESTEKRTAASKQARGTALQACPQEV
jgi:hypothetical protein